MSDTLGGAAAKYEELIYISQAARGETQRKVEKCDSYKRNMRGEMIYTTAPHSM